MRTLEPQTHTVTDFIVTSIGWSKAGALIAAEIDRLQRRAES